MENAVFWQRRFRRNRIQSWSRSQSGADAKPVARDCKNSSTASIPPINNFDLIPAHLFCMLELSVATSDTFRKI